MFLYRRNLRFVRTVEPTEKFENVLYPKFFFQKTTFKQYGIRRTVAGHETANTAAIEEVFFSPSVFPPV